MNSAKKAAASDSPKKGWTEEAHEDLLLCLLIEFKPGKPVVELLEQRMKTFGHSFSYDAINQHIQKIRKNGYNRHSPKLLERNPGPQAARPERDAAGKEGTEMCIPDAVVEEKKERTPLPTCKPAPKLVPLSTGRSGKSGKRKAAEVPEAVVTKGGRPKKVTKVSPPVAAPNQAESAGPSSEEASAPAPLKKEEDSPIEIGNIGGKAPEAKDVKVEENEENIVVI